MTDSRLPLVLASQSPRRAALLRAAGIAFELGAAPDIDERVPEGMTAGPAVEVIAVRKARVAAARVPGRTVLTADTLVFLDGKPVGKPVDVSDAREMLTALSGRAHDVCSGVALAESSAADLRLASVHTCARVQFRPLSAQEIADYVATGEPLDKAGAYAIQGEAAAFASCLPADRDTVIGLPVAAVRALLADWLPRD